MNEGGGKVRGKVGRKKGGRQAERKREIHCHFAFFLL